MSTVKRILWVSVLLGALLSASSLVAAAEPAQRQAIVAVRGWHGPVTLEELSERLGMTKEELVEQLNPLSILRRLAEERGLDWDQTLKEMRDELLERFKDKVTENKDRTPLRRRAGSFQPLPRLAPRARIYVTQPGVVISPFGSRFTTVRPFGWAAPRTHLRVLPPHVQVPRIVAPGIGRGINSWKVIERYQPARPRLDGRDKDGNRVRPRTERGMVNKQAPEAGSGEPSQDSST